MTQDNMTAQNIKNCFIKAITLEDYKSIKSLQNFQMSPVNILIGANGAGKTAFLKFFELLKYCLMEEFMRDDYIAKKGGADWLLTGGIKNNRVELGNHGEFIGNGIYTAIEFNFNNITHSDNTDFYKSLKGILKLPSGTLIENNLEYNMQSIRKCCRHFDVWLQQLEKIGV